MTLPEKILRLRKQSGMSQEELAQKLEVSRQAVSRWEVGSAQPDASNILQLSRLFGVTADYLLNDDYESDRDLPAVRNTETTAKWRMKRIILGYAAAMGLLGNFIIYILSRAIEVAVPRVRVENGVKTYTWNADLTGRSFKYFVQEYDLQLLVWAFWIIFAAGLIGLVLSSGRVRALILPRLKALVKRKK